jgi:hypothetical protein
MVNGTSVLNSTGAKVFDFKHNFAISQTWRCGKKNRILDELKKHRENPEYHTSDRQRQSDTWIACDRVDLKNSTLENEVSVMGYAMRGMYYR